MIILFSVMVSAGQEPKQDSGGQSWLQVPRMAAVRRVCSCNSTG